MTQLNVWFFGRWQAQLDELTFTTFESHKVDELFCYLMLNRHRPHTRDALAGLLWPEAAPAQARNYLRKTLWQLQRALPKRQMSGAEWLLVEQAWVSIGSEAGIALDIDVFENSFQDTCHVAGQELSSAHAQALQQAVELYRGDLLEGWYYDWLLVERERLRLAYVLMLEKLMTWSESQGDYEAGLAYGWRILQLDAAHERTHRLLMRFYVQAGRPAAALRQYRQCADILRRELNVEPSERTRALYDEILRHWPEADQHEAQQPPTGGALLLDRVNALQATLDVAQHEIRQLRRLLVSRHV